MNLLLLRDEDFVGVGAEPGTQAVRLTGRRALHAHEVLRASHGVSLRVGRLGGLMGHGEVVRAEPGLLELLVSLSDPPPPRARCDLLLAIPRPKALKKVLPAAASLGVGKLVLVNAARVEKSYFDSKVLEPAFLEELLVLGLEQARDTVLPQVLVRERFRPFVEDELPALFEGARKLLPHPTAQEPLPRLSAGEPAVFAVGPEGGWVPFEVDLLQAAGFQPFTLGPRVLRVEVCVPYLLGAKVTP
ncbi:MAG TPA: 16S rRNA (uracil(1498)-N(3))-methyltransferase [Myxococcaceae bacterium]